MPPALIKTSYRYYAPFPLQPPGYTPVTAIIMQEITINRPGTAAAATSVKSSAVLLPEEPAASVQHTVESAAKIPSTLLIPEEPETPSALLVPEEPETPKASTATKTRKLFIQIGRAHV